MKKKVSLLIIFVFILSGCGAKDKATNNNIVKQEFKDLGFDGQVSDFNDVYKKTLNAISNKQKDEAERGMREMISYWLEIEKKWLKNKPREYIITRDWEAKISLISELNKKASDLLAQGKFEEAYVQLEDIRLKIKQLREENKIKNISNNFLSLSEEVEKISKMEERADVIKNLPILKIKFTEIKEFFPDNQEYQQQLIYFSEVISDIENSSEATFKKNRDRLKPAFMVLYYKFG